MPRWTPETRLKQAAAIRHWMPWTLSTGPVTAAGVARVTLNAWKDGVRAKVANRPRTVSQIVLSAESLYSLLRLKHDGCAGFRQHPAKDSNELWVFRFIRQHLRTEDQTTIMIARSSFLFHSSCKL